MYFQPRNEIIDYNIKFLFRSQKKETNGKRKILDKSTISILIDACIYM